MFWNLTYLSNFGTGQSGKGNLQLSIDYNLGCVTILIGKTLFDSAILEIIYKFLAFTCKNHSANVSERFKLLIEGQKEKNWEHPYISCKCMHNWAFS